MATVTGYTAERMNQISNETVIDGNVVGDNLILVTRGGTQIDAGSVRGPIGPNGPSMVIVERVADLPVYTAGAGHDTEVAFVNETNDFHIWSDATLKWAVIASTVPAAVGNPVLLASSGGSALFGHTGPGTQAGLEVTAAGGLVLKSVTDIRLGTKNGGQPLILPAGGGVQVVGRLQIDQTYLQQVGAALKITDAAGAARAIIAAAATIEGTLQVAGASYFQAGNFSGHVIVPTLQATGIISADRITVASELQVIDRIVANRMHANSEGIFPSLYSGNVYVNNAVETKILTISTGGPSGSPNGNDYWSTYPGLRLIAPPGMATALMSFNVPSRGWAAMWGLTDVGTDPSLHALNLANTGYVAINAANLGVGSSRLTKSNIEDAPTGVLKKLAKIKAKKFKRTTSPDDAPPEIGLILEEMEAAGFSDLVRGEAHLKNYSLPGLVAYLVDAVNELSAKVAALEASA